MATDEQRILELDAQREIRSATFQPIDVADDGSWFEGYAAVFDEDATFKLNDGVTVTESVQRGAFRKALTLGDNIPMLYHHLDTHPPLATTGGGTLQLEENAKGLRTRANIARGYIGDAVRELVLRGDIPGMSWGFIAGAGNSKIERRNGGYHRTLVGFKKILDVSPTWDPSYRGTEAQFRSQVYGGMLLPGEQLVDDGASPQVVDDEGNTGSDQETTEPTGDVEETRSAAGATVHPAVAARMRALQVLIFQTGGTERVDQTR